MHANRNQTFVLLSTTSRLEMAIWSSKSYPYTTRRIKVISVIRNVEASF